MSSAAVVAENWLQSLRDSTQEVFQIMLGTNLEASGPEPMRGIEFTALVGLAGSLCGIVSVRCGQQVAHAIASAMLKLPAQHAAEHAWDALGEVANMIAGNFKNRIQSISDECLLSVPTVITGADYSFHSLADIGPIELWFRFQDSPLRIALEIHS